MRPIARSCAAPKVPGRDAVSSLAGTVIVGRCIRNGGLRRSTTDLQRTLAPGSALVEYVVGADQTAVFVLTHATVRAQLLPVGETSYERASSCCAACWPGGSRTAGSRWPSGWTPSCSIRCGAPGWLSGVSRLYIVPHAELNYLPFVVLRHQTPRGARLLVDDVATGDSAGGGGTGRARARAVHGAPSEAAFWRWRRRARDCALPARRSSRSHGSFRPRARYSWATRRPNRGSSKTPSRFRVLHLATHGFFNRVDPLFSGVELEADATDDGRLQVFEILGLRLGADLVTLSACDTALGGGELERPAGR